jgi:hypothetical protein
MSFNIVVILLTGLIPLLIGFFWYSNMGFGKAWMKEVGFTQESMQGANMALIFGLTLLMGEMLSIAITQLVVHQSHYYSILANENSLKDPNSALSQSTKAFMDAYGHNFRTFKHGLLHGTIGALFIAFPIICINGLFERRSRKYILIHTGYWVVTMALMGGIICQFA